MYNLNIFQVKVKKLNKCIHKPSNKSEEVSAVHHERKFTNKIRQNVANLIT